MEARLTSQIIFNALQINKFYWFIVDEWVHVKINNVSKNFLRLKK